jgi:hypothetical protein
MRKHEGGQADEINEERKGERQIAFVHEKKIGERETLAGVGRRVDADVHTIQFVRPAASGQPLAAVGTLLLPYGQLVQRDCLVL